MEKSGLKLNWKNDYHKFKKKEINVVNSKSSGALTDEFQILCRREDPNCSGCDIYRNTDKKCKFCAGECSCSYIASTCRCDVTLPV